MTKEHRLSEKGKPCPRTGRFKVEHVKYGNRHYGWFLTMPYAGADGKPLRIYLARRAPNEFFRADQTWAIDLATLAFLRCRGCTRVGIQVSDGRLLMIPMDQLRPDPARGIVIRNYESRAGARQLYVPEKLWQIHKPPPAVTAAVILSEMHLPATRTRKPKATKSPAPATVAG